MTQIEKKIGKSLFPCYLFRPLLERYHVFSLLNGLLNSQINGLTFFHSSFIVMKRIGGSRIKDKKLGAICCGKVKQVIGGVIGKCRKLESRKF